MTRTAKREYIIPITMISVMCFLLSGLVACATFRYITQAPEIDSDAYSIEGNRVVVVLDKAPELAEVGGSVTIVDDNLPNYLIIARAEETDYVVASSQCSHRGMALGYDHDAKCFRCSSAGKSTFKLDGSVVKGPAEKPLKIYRSSLEQGLLIINLSD